MDSSFSQPYACQCEETTAGSVVKTNNLPDYSRIALTELAQLNVDAESARQFERRFYPGLLGGAALIFGGMGGSSALHHFAIVDDFGFVVGAVSSFVVGLALALWAHHRMMRARPRSSQSGRVMEPFVIQDLEASDHYELAYVDRESGTYFRRLYVERGG